MMRTAFLATVAMLFACNRLPYELTPQEEAQLAKLEDKMDALKDRQPAEPQGYERESYEYFVTHHGYPTCMLMYKNDKLMDSATHTNSKIYICLSQQRGRLYVDGTIAADWPVSTGVPGRATATGTFSILEKKKHHKSGRFGVITNSAGKVVVGSADSRRHSVPRGGRWEGSAMNNWMRLTDYGMGMHTGHVVEGKRLSHGCIRMPDNVASPIFEFVKVGYKVTVTDGLEDCYPCRSVLDSGREYNAWVREKKVIENEMKDVHKTAKDRAEGKPLADAAE